LELRHYGRVLNIHDFYIVNIKVAAVVNYLEMRYRPDDWSELLTVTSLGYDSLVKDYHAR